LRSSHDLFPIFFWPIFFDVPAVLFLGIWFLEQLFAGSMLALSPVAAQAGGIAWWAHVGGFVSGAILVWAFHPRQRSAPHGAQALHERYTPRLR